MTFGQVIPEILRVSRGGLAGNIAEVDVNKRFQERAFDVIFHLASITDTTEQNQYRQVHDNVEGFRKFLHCAMSDQTPLVYASSAAVYGKTDTVTDEKSKPSPQNAYAFSKMQ